MYIQTSWGEYSKHWPKQIIVQTKMHGITTDTRQRWLHVVIIFTYFWCQLSIYEICIKLSLKSQIIKKENTGFKTFKSISILSNNSYMNKTKICEVFENQRKKNKQMIFEMIVWVRSFFQKFYIILYHAKGCTD